MLVTDHMKRFMVSLFGVFSSTNPLLVVDLFHKSMYNITVVYYKSPED